MRAKESCRRACEYSLAQSQIIALVHVTFQPFLVREYSLAFPALAGPSAPPLALILQLCKATRTYYWRHGFNLKEWTLFVLPACIETRTFEPNSSSYGTCIIIRREDVTLQKLFSQVFPLSSELVPSGQIVPYQIVPLRSAPFRLAPARLAPARLAPSRMA